MMLGQQSRGDGGQFVDPSFMLTHIGERKNEIHQMNGSNSVEENILTAPENTLMATDRSGEDDKNNKRIKVSQTDPFMLLKEVVQMSKYMNPSATSDMNNSSTKTSEFQMKCEVNLSNYKALVQNNFDKMVNEGDDQTKAMAEKYNPLALQEKIKGFKFTKVNADSLNSKDTNWFQKLNNNSSQSSQATSPMRKVGGLYKFQMTKEEHQKFNQELVQKYIQQKEELQPQYDQLKRVNQQLEEIRTEFGIEHVKVVKPKLTTSFMQIKDATQRREYEEKVKVIRQQRHQTRRGIEKQIQNAYHTTATTKMTMDQRSSSQSKLKDVVPLSASRSQNRSFLDRHQDAPHHHTSESIRKNSSHLSIYSKRSQSSILRQRNPKHKNKDVTKFRKNDQDQPDDDSDEDEDDDDDEDEEEEEEEEYDEELEKAKKEFEHIIVQQKQMIFNPEPLDGSNNVSTKDGGGGRGGHDMSCSGMPDDDEVIDNPDRTSVEFVEATEILDNDTNQQLSNAIVTKQNGLIDQEKTLKLLQQEPRKYNQTQSIMIANNRRALNTSYQTKRYHEANKLHTSQSNSSNNPPTINFNNNKEILRSDTDQGQGTKPTAIVSANVTSMNSLGNNSNNFRAQYLKHIVDNQFGSGMSMCNCRGKASCPQVRCRCQSAQKKKIEKKFQHVRRSVFDNQKPRDHLLLTDERRDRSSGKKQSALVSKKKQITSLDGDRDSARSTKNETVIVNNSLRGTTMDYFKDKSTNSSNRHNKEMLQNGLRNPTAIDGPMIVINENELENQSNGVNTRAQLNQTRIFSGELSFKEAILPMIEQNQVVAFAQKQSLKNKQSVKKLKQQFDQQSKQYQDSVSKIKNHNHILKKSDNKMQKLSLNKINQIKMKTLEKFNQSQRDSYSRSKSPQKQDHLEEPSGMVESNNSQDLQDLQKQNTLMLLRMEKRGLKKKGKDKKSAQRQAREQAKNERTAAAQNISNILGHQKLFNRKNNSISSSSQYRVNSSNFAKYTQGIIGGVGQSFDQFPLNAQNKSIFQKIMNQPAKLAQNPEALKTRRVMEDCFRLDVSQHSLQRNSRKVKNVSNLAKAQTTYATHGPPCHQMSVNEYFESRNDKDGLFGQSRKQSSSRCSRSISQTRSRGTGNNSKASKLRQSSTFKKTTEKKVKEGSQRYGPGNKTPESRDPSTLIHQLNKDAQLRQGKILTNQPYTEQSTNINSQIRIVQNQYEDGDSTESIHDAGGNADNPQRHQEIMFKSKEQAGKYSQNFKRPFDNFLNQKQYRKSGSRQCKFLQSQQQSRSRGQHASHDSSESHRLKDHSKSRKQKLHDISMPPFRQISSNKLRLSTIKMQKLQNIERVPSQKKANRLTATLSPSNHILVSSQERQATKGPEFERKILTLYHTTFGQENNSNFNTHRDSYRKKSTNKRKKVALTPINHDLLSMKNLSNRQQQPQDTLNFEIAGSQLIQQNPIRQIQQSLLNFDTHSLSKITRKRDYENEATSKYI